MKDDIFINSFILIANAILLILIVILGWHLIRLGFHRQAIHECQTWQQQAEEYKHYFLTEWQKEQCDEVGIIINAPVKHGHNKIEGKGIRQGIE